MKRNTGDWPFADEEDAVLAELGIHCRCGSRCCRHRKKRESPTAQQPVTQPARPEARPR